MCVYLLRYARNINIFIPHSMQKNDTLSERERESIAVFESSGNMVEFIKLSAKRAYVCSLRIANGKNRNRYIHRNTRCHCLCLFMSDSDDDDDISA